MIVYEPFLRSPDQNKSGCDCACKVVKDAVSADVAEAHAGGLGVFKAFWPDCCDSSLP